MMQILKTTAKGLLNFLENVFKNIFLVRKKINDINKIKYINFNAAV